MKRATWARDPFSRFFLEGVSMLHSPSTVSFGAKLGEMRNGYIARVAALALTALKS